MLRRRSHKIVLLAGIAAFVAGVMSAERLFERAAAPDGLAAADEFLEARLASVEEIVLDGMIEAPVAFEAETRAAVIAPDVARVAFLAPSGRRVTRGATVARLESAERIQAAPNPPAAAAAPIDEREIARLEERLLRLEELYRLGALARRELEAARRESAELRAATMPPPRPERVDPPPPPRQRRLPAPIDGVVLERLAAPGEIVPAHAPLLIIGRPESIRPVLRIDSTLAAGLVPGLPVTLIRDGRPISATLARIARLETAPEEAQTTRVVLAVANGGNPAETGPVTARLATGERRRSLFAPLAALETDARGERRVWRLRDGRARATVVRTGLADERRVEILEGLSAGDSLILDPGRVRPREGMRVRNAAPAAAE